LSRFDLKAGVDQPLNDDFGRFLRVRDNCWKASLSKRSDKTSFEAIADRSEGGHEN
jgi:hypothetical protein